jgi:hypothetical protein
MQQLVQSIGVWESIGLVIVIAATIYSLTRKYTTKSGSRGSTTNDQQQ